MSLIVKLQLGFSSIGDMNKKNVLMLIRACKFTSTAINCCDAIMFANIVFCC